MKEIDAVGHRVVHGGEKFASSVLITDEVKNAGLLVEDVEHLVDADAVLVHDELDNAGVEIAAAGAHRQTDQGSKAHGGVNALAAVDGCDGAAVAHVAGNDLQLLDGLAHELCAAAGDVASMKEIDAVGHRVVHGGEAFNKSVLITDEVMKALEDCIPLAPLHNPANITGINACTAVMGKDVPQVAVFDTAFHQTMPAKAYMYALPYEYYEKDKVRRYGFHGTSHRRKRRRCPPYRTSC